MAPAGPPTPGHPQPRARRAAGLSGCLSSQKLLLYGGAIQAPRTGDTIALADTSVLDLAARRWTGVTVKAEDGVGPRVGFGMVGYKGQVFVFGGLCGTQVCACLKSCVYA